MRKLIHYVLFILLSLWLLASCESEDDFTTIDLSTSLTEVVPVNISDTGMIEFSELMVIDPAINEEIKRYQSQIESVGIVKVSFKILNYNGSDSTEFEGKIRFDGTTFELDLPKTTLKETSDNKVVTTLSVSNEEFADLTDIFRNLNPTTIFCDGIVYNAPAKFDLEVAIGLQAEAKVLP